MSNKRYLDRAALDALLKEAGVEPVDTVEELTEGTFNTVYRLGQDLILKLSPDPDAPVLSYEEDLIHTEAEFYRAALGKAPVPEVVHTGEDYLLMTALPGTTMQSAGIAGAERARLRRELGGIVASLHEVTGTGFGYPQKGLVATWSDAFLAMVDDVLADAERFAVTLPRPAAQIWQLVLDRANLLNEVHSPRLIHFDLWDGNILVEDGRITGLVDGERAFWGDPVAEFVSLTLFSSLDEELLAGYGAAVDGERLSLYRIYLYLIMLVEGTPRGYEGAEREAMVKLIVRHLVKDLDSL